MTLVSDIFPTPAQVRAARALLAWNQTDLARAAKVATSTVADFERSERTPVANNAQAIRDALTAERIIFQDDGVVLAQGSTPTVTVRPGRPWRWIHASDLAQWAGRRDGPAALPELISRLILVSCGPIALRFPADDSIQYPGWDGLCDSPVDNAFVPEGTSVWELGAQRDGISRKANSDYLKRREDPLGVDPASTTYVFVTPHRWPQKDQWAAARTAEGYWKAVRAIDGDELVHWLEQFPGVAEWLATRIGKKPDGLTSLTERWEQWSLATKPALPPALIVADRDEEVARVLKWLYAPASLIALQAEAVDEAIAFLHAALEPLPDLYRTFWLSRIAVAGNDRAAADLLELGAPLIIVLSGGDPGLAARLVEAGHHVYMAFGSDAGTPPDVLRLPRPWTHTLEQALLATGLDEQRVRLIGRQAGRSLTVIRRLMPIGPAPRPAWANPPVTHAVIAAMLAGAWDAERSADRAILERLSGLSYEVFEAALAPLAAALDGPVRKSGRIWKLASLRDSWFLLAAYLTEAQVTKMLECFHEVLSAADPAFNDPDRRWRFDRTPPTSVSDELRHGLTEAVIGLGVFGEQAVGIRNPVARADYAIRQLFEGADEHLWWSLSNDFRRLAEASPEAFLAALDDSFASNDQAFRILFRQDEGLLHAREYLANLLWALELLAWSPDHVGHATLILARLAEIDPGGKTRNRPAESLMRIFLPWLPQAAANAEERLRLIDRITKHYPDVGWALLLALSPSLGGGITHRTAVPCWRDFGGKAPERVTNHSLYASYSGIADRLLDLAGDSPTRWSALIDHWASFAPEWRSRAGAALAEVVDRFDREDRIGLRETLRTLILKHESFNTADWAMDDEALEPLRSTFAALEPRSALDRHVWLFTQANRLYDHHLSWHEALERQEKAQREAVEEIWRDAQDADFLDYARRVERPDSLGKAVALADMPGWDKEAGLDHAIALDDEVAERFAQGMLIGLAATGPDDALPKRFDIWCAEGRSMHQLLAIAFLLPANQPTWDRVYRAGPNVEQGYWQRIATFAIHKAEDVDRVVAKLLAVDRGRGAIEFIGAHDDVPIAGKTVIAALEHPSSINPPAVAVEARDGTMFSFYAARLFSRLDKDDSVDDQQIASLEWIYFQALQHSERPTRLLHQALAHEPKFFVDLLSMVFSAEGEDPVELEDVHKDTQVQAATQAFNVLESWGRVPGSDEEGRIDAAMLEAWVKNARKLCAEARRADIGDYKIGEILSSARRMDGEAWPPESVRDIIEVSRSRDMERGFEFGLYNRRGVTTRMPHDGGEQERVLAARYRRDARHSALEWPRTRALLERIAEHYERDAQWEDQSAEQRDWL